MTPNRVRVLLAAKITLLALFVFGTNLGVVERVKAIGLQPGLAVFALIWALALFALISVAFSPRFKVRLAWTLVLTACSVFGLSFHLITAKPLTLSDFERLIGLIAFSGDVTAFYWNFLLTAAVWSALGAAALNIPPFVSEGEKHRVLWALRQTSALQIAPVLAICLILYSRGGMGANGLPVQFTPLGYAALLGTEKLFVPSPPPRRSVTIDARPTRLRNVVLIMDESVRGDYLDLNHPSGARTGLASAPSADAVVNFGIASSHANCSETSNVSMRFGVTRKNYLGDLATNPSLWEYAKKAGYSTSYLDAQRHGRGLQNFMDERELLEVDRFVQLPSDTPADQKEQEIARRLLQILSEPGSHFVYLNKMGCHFPYEGKYPASSAVFSPTMTRTYFGNESDPRVKKSSGVGENDGRQRLRFVNSYKNCLAWNIGKFFDTLLSQQSLTDTAIVYTSDHGQDFHEDGSPGFGTHCSDGPAPPGEGIVPMAVLTREPVTRDLFRESARVNHGRASGFNVFPTLLHLMGYRLEDLDSANRFEPSLLNPLPQGEQKFLSTYFVRFGQKPVWNGIQIRPIPAPAAVLDKVSQIKDGEPPK